MHYYAYHGCMNENRKAKDVDVNQYIVFLGPSLWAVDICPTIISAVDQKKKNL